MIRIHEIIEKLVSYRPDAEVDLVRKAYVWSAKLHKSQIRRSGLPYLSHPLEVAGILTELKQGEVCLAGGLLHDTLEDSAITFSELEREFGKEVAELVDGVTKMGMVSRASRPEMQAEYLRKMILAMAKDIRVILIKLADRLHNMRTLEYLPEEKQRQIAEETLELYSPIAHRLGIYWIKAELEDLSFRYLKPEIYFRLVKQVSKLHRERERYLEEVKELLKKRLNEAGLKCEVQARLKHYYGIYQKMEQQKLSVDQVYDIFAFRILCNTIRECYEALYVIHSFWTPVPGRIKDYIALPKANMYQSLHTTVIGPEQERIEIQIRTYEMHRVAEDGIAAHWKYKEGKAIDEAEEQQFAWLKRLIEFQQELSDPHQFLETVKSDLFPDEVYVFTPKGDLKVFPKGATPLDFAYSIHTELGEHCAGAKINNRIVPLSYSLKSGDVVEIITSRDTHPIEHWLKLVVTPKARTKINHWLHSREIKRAKEIGRQLLEEEMLKYDLRLAELIKNGTLDEIARKFNFADHSKLLEAIGYKKFPNRKVITSLVPPSELRRRSTSSKKLQRKIKQKQKEKALTLSKDLIIRSDNDPLIKFAQCCSPIPGEDIIAYLEEGKGITVHRADCARILDYYSGQLIKARFANKVKGLFSTELEVVTVDEKGLLSRMSGAISSSGININKAMVRTTEDQKGIATFDIKVKNLKQLQKVITKLEKIPGVISVSRVFS